MALALLGGATTLALVSASQLYFNWTSHGYEADFLQLTGLKFVEWGLWAAFVPLIVRIERRQGVEARSLVRRLFAHLGAALAFFAILNGVLSGLSTMVETTLVGGFGEIYMQRAEAKVATALLVYAAILATSYMLRLREERHIEAAWSARLRADLADARLLNLRMQIHPHFLFNTLHTVAALVREGDRATAVETLEELSELLRRALRSVEQQEVPLSEEIEFLQRYVNVQHLRFGERLQVELNVDEDVLDALVPSLLLQPLVENAIRHGLDLDHGIGRVQVSAQRMELNVVIAIEDNGVGMAPGALQEGLGLGTTRRRLEELYRSRASLQIRGADNGGTRVIVCLPFHVGLPLLPSAK